MVCNRHNINSLLSAHKVNLVRFVRKFLLSEINLRSSELLLDKFLSIEKFNRKLVRFFNAKQTE